MANTPSRTPEQIRRNYEIERELADRLRAAQTPQERRELYAAVYDELFRRVPDHPAHFETPEDLDRRAEAQMTFLRRFLGPNEVLLDIGAGNGALAFKAAGHVKKIYALDVVDQLPEDRQRPENLELVISQGTDVPVPEGSVTVAHSNQLMEHLHPDDAYQQLENICKVLAPGGKYICVTPNRLSGPYDVSRRFDEVATGLHLKEYLNGELSRLFRDAGFSRVVPYAGIRQHYRPVPLAIVKSSEAVLSQLPHKISKAIAIRQPMRAILGIRLVGIK